MSSSKGYDPEQNGVLDPERGSQIPRASCARMSLPLFDHPGLCSTRATIAKTDVQGKQHLECYVRVHAEFAVQSLCGTKLGGLGVDEIAGGTRDGAGRALPSVT
jgi:hypothetical protein